MLIVSGATRAENRRVLGKELRRPRVPVRLTIRGSRLALEAVLWREYWEPCLPFFGVDLRLIQRLNRLKKAWLGVLRHPADRGSRMGYCWRYFGLLHNALRIAQDEPGRPDPMTAIRRIIGFETFGIEATGQPGRAACTVTSRNPSFLLGQLPDGHVVPTPRHVSLLVPLGQDSPYYHYRQLLVSGMPVDSLLVNPAVSLPDRATSFIPIDRLTRLISDRSDPYWKPRAWLLARRVLAPLLRTWSRDPNAGGSPLSVLDLGAGTGHMVAKAWTYLGRMSTTRLPVAAFHFVDISPPSSGRSFGLARDRTGVAHVEWTTADYRTLVDDDEWLRRAAPWHWVFACRVFDNASNFMIERVDEFRGRRTPASLDCLPHRCLSPRSLPDGIRRLLVSPLRWEANGGSVLPQFSLRDYFAGIKAIQDGGLDDVHKDAWYLPVRRFNPASLITPSGRSLLAQLMKVSRAVIIEDVDVEPDHLRQHRAQFGLAGTSAVFCTRDGFDTESRYYIITSPEWAGRIRGKSLW